MKFARSVLSGQLVFPGQKYCQIWHILGCQIVRYGIYECFHKSALLVLHVNKSPKSCCCTKEILPNYFSGQEYLQLWLTSYCFHQLILCVFHLSKSADYSKSSATLLTGWGRITEGGPWSPKVFSILPILYFQFLCS